MRVEVSRESLAEAAVRDLILFAGDDPDREGLKETPSRVVRAFTEMFSGYSQCPDDVLVTFAAEGYDEIVLLKSIPVASTCEHHMLPFTGVAHVAYVPKGHIVGISKLARLVDVYAKRLQVQERLTQQVAGKLEAALKPLGAACVIEATHSCVGCRGVKKQGAVMVTSSLTGCFKTQPDCRAELMSLIRE